ncbi:LamG-like jellyroll fold domain-containing protein [Bacteroides finegoldii]|uniref:LamG-like jellyroll fold domain-containing protein n=1 Tax=Bacteroides finegoldii TaxID=338188 RepID=UPI0018A0DAB9|nr:LamG-like jellyroll fold domain-containing protein [Bacteroides finegoldii]
MKRKLSFLFLSALTIPFLMVSCSDDKEEQEVKPAADLVFDNSSVTLLQGDEITVGITSGNGDYYVKPFDESVATATVNGNKVTIKATENSELEENNRTETTVLVIDGRKKVARIQVQVAKLWNLTVDTPEEGFDLFIGEKRLIKILTGNGDYQISVPEGADKYLEVGELSGQTFPVTAKFETETDHPIEITITDKKDKTVVIPIVVNIVDLTLKSNDAIFAEPDAESQYIAIEKGNGGYTFTYQVEGGEPTADATIVEASEDENLITLKPKARGDVKVIVTDQKGSEEVIAVKVNPYKLKASVEAVSIGGFKASTEFSIVKGNGEYVLQALSEADQELMDVIVLDEGTYKVTAKKLGATNLVITDQAGEKLTLPVSVNPVAADIGGDRYFYMDVKNLNHRIPELGLQHLSQVTYEIIFYPNDTRGLQTFMGLEGNLLLRSEEGRDTNPHFQIAFKANGLSNPYLLSEQVVYSDRKDANAKKPGKWYHVALVYDGTQPNIMEAYKLYINGVQEKLTGKEDYSNKAPNSSMDLTIMNADNYFMIGRANNNDYRNGLIRVYQARIWKTARTEQEIKENLCELKSGYNTDDLVGYWIFSDGIEKSEYEDLSGHEMNAKVGDHNGAKPSTITADRYKPVECPHSY